MADVLDDDLDARVAAGVGDPPELLGGDLAELGVVAVGGGRVEDGLFRAQLAGGLQESALVVDDGVVDLGDVAGQPLAVREVDEQIAAGERVVETFRVDIARHERRLADPELAEVEPLRRRREPVEVVADGEPDIHAGGGCGVCL